MAFPKRNQELCRLDYVKEQMVEVYRAVERGFLAQADRSNDQQDYWKIWNCERSTNQFYSGNTKVYLPLVRNAVKARRTRFIGQVFPETGRNVAVVSHDEETPDAQVALIEHYIRRAELRALVVPALLVAGDVEGQMTVLVTWSDKKRSVVERIPQPIRVMGMDVPSDIAEPVLVLKESEIEDAGPDIEVVLDSDLLILPATADGIGQALADGGSATVIRRWGKDRLEELIEAGELLAESAEELLAELRADTPRNQARENLDSAGIKSAGGNRYALVYRIWTRIDIGTGKDKAKRLVLAYMTSENQLLSCRLCPYWCDKPDVISVALDKLPGNAKGMSQIKPGVADMQYSANDLICEGLDAATYSLLPVLRYDPDRVPNVDALIMDLMALWPAPQGAIEPVPFPRELLTEAFNAVLAAERMINSALSVTPAGMTQPATNRKPNQAEVAMMQQVEVMQTADAVIALETGLLTPLVERMAEYDAQFRDREVTIQSYGELGLKVEMVTVPPIQMGRRWEYQWFGVQAARSAQQIQQQIAAINVIGNLANHPSVAAAGKRLNLVPVISHIVETAFNPRLAPRIFEDVAADISVPPELENQLLAMGLEAVVSPLDNDPQHIQAHMQVAQQSGFGTPAFLAAQTHIAHHQAAMRQKQQAQMQAQMQQQTGQPGGQPGRQLAGRRPGARGPTPPMPGGQPGAPRPLRGPPGAVHPDQMVRGGVGGVIPMPRARMVR